MIDGVWLRGCFESDVGYAVALEEEDLIASCDEHRGAYDAGLGDGLFRDGVQVWLRGLGGGGGSQAQQEGCGCEGTAGCAHRVIIVRGFN